ncbi:ABC-type amino acid transport/signal transduction systems, periplasmic component/domain [Alteromonadaceae bacterium Bs31]|nr:ABC-type amino acid transport/signal transduction systems, periplasmic component/domain [Alteromonadaceae bacterium Bs31]
MRTRIFAALIYLSSGIAWADKTPSTPAFSMWLGGSQGRQAYDKTLVWLALEKSREEFGPFSLSTHSRRLNFERERIAYSRARQFQIHVAPYYEITLENRREFTRIKEPIINGILGYRQLIIRKEDKNKFAKVKTLDDLKKLSAGQGARWPDADILRNSGIKVVEAHEFDALFAMLEKKRFDFIPLGINEIRECMTQFQHRYPEFIIEQDLVLHYPLSNFMFVADNQTELAKRLEYGLKKMKKDGSFDSLFALHFQKNIKHINRPETRLLLLANTGLSSESASVHPALLHSDKKAASSSAISAD